MKKVLISNNGVALEKGQRIVVFVGGGRLVTTVSSLRPKSNEIVTSRFGYHIKAERVTVLD